MSDNLKEIYLDICNGFSEIDYKNNTIFVKHFNEFDQYQIDKEKSKYFKAAIKRKIPTLIEKLEWLDKEGIWTKKDESDLEQQRSFVDSMKKSKSKLLIKAQIRQREKEIIKEEEKLVLLYNNREELIGLTAENYADKKLQNYYIFYAFYKNKELNGSFFNKNNFNDLDDEEIDILLSEYLNVISKFSQENIKKISINPFFTGYFSLVDKIASFFDKPIYTLTFNQINLLSYADYFKKIFENYKIPEEIQSDPIKIEDFVNRLQNSNNLKAQAGDKGGTLAIIGATKEDADVLGGYDLRDSSIEKINKKGGASDIWEANNKNAQK